MSATDVGNWIAFASLLVVVTGAAITFAFMLGGINSRVKNHGGRIKDLEDSDQRSGGQQSAMTAAVSRLEGFMTSEVKHLSEGLSELKAEIRGNGRRRAPRSPQD